MSRINGDKARFNPVRKQRALQRKRNHELRQTIGLPKASAAKAGKNG